MSQWQDRFSNHDVWKHMPVLGSTIDQAATREGIDPETTAGLERLRTVLAFAGKRLAGADASLVLVAPLDAINLAILNAVTELQSFVTNGNAGHVTNANLQGDVLLTNLSSVVVPITPDDTGALKDSAVAYRRTLEEQLSKASSTYSKIAKNSDDTNKRLEALAAEIGAERHRLSSMVSEFQVQFSTAQELRNRENADATSSRQEKFGALVSDYSKKLIDQDADFTRQKETAFLKYADDVTELKKQYGSTAEAILEKITQQKVEVEKLVGVIGNLGVTSGYLKYANRALYTTWFWQVITVVALIGLILFAYYAFLPAANGQTTWESLAARVFLTFTVGVLAAYAARQADKQMEIERRNRKHALEFEALGPFLASLPQEKQDEFRLRVGELSFGREEPSLRRGDKSPATVADLFTQAPEVRQILAQLSEAALKANKSR